MPHQASWTTRLKEYIAHVLPWAHGHQLKGITTLVEAILGQQTGNPAALARGWGNQEAAVKRLSRLRHNERLAPHRLADAVLGQALRQLPPKGKVRLARDWTIEGTQHLLGVSLVTGGRAVTAVKVFGSAFSYERKYFPRKFARKGHRQYTF